MGYMNMDQLYKNTDILLFKECYAMEKIHGTSAHISYKNGEVKFFAGGGKHEVFLAMFDIPALTKKLVDLFGEKEATIYGEYYGGNMQGMSDTYGKVAKFIAFDTQIDGMWVNVPKAEAISHKLGIEFVYYALIPATIEAIDAQRDSDSVQAIRNGLGEGHKREGVVLRPIDEFTKNDGSRIISKHKRDEFRETKTVHPVSSEKLKLIEDAKLIAEEWVTHERLNHILTSGEVTCDIENTGKVISMMVDDIIKEGSGELVDSKEARTEISRKTALMFKEILRGKIND
jgi:hypothetical protein